MLRNYMGIINLEENETNIRSLTSTRPIATIPIGARFRVIDFMLSNMVNAGITNVSVFSDKATRSLIDHLGSGRPWDLDRKTDGLFLFSGSLLGNSREISAQSFNYTMDFFSNAKYENVIIAPSYMIANMDLDLMAEKHEASGADISVVYTHSDETEQRFINCDLLYLDENGRVKNVSKNIGIEDQANVSMEIFFMKKSLFTELLYDAIREGAKGSFKDRIYDSTKTLKINAIEFCGYTACINSISEFYDANMKMLELDVTGELFSHINPIYTKTKDSPPAQYVGKSKVSHSIIADGSLIKGEVKDSLVFRNVKIEEGAVLDGCIVLPNAVIGKDAVLTNVIIDKGVKVDAGTEIKCPKQYPLVVEKKLYNK